MDSCFLCLNMTKNNPCNQCSLRAHLKCWEKYVKISYKNQDMNYQIKCPVCKQDVEYESRITRSIAKSRKKMTIINTIKEYIDAIESENYNTRLEKITIARELYNYLYDNIDFVYSVPVFEKTVRNKMIELGNVEKWNYMNVMYMKMFGEKLPKEYI